MAKSKYGILWSRKANLEVRKIRENITSEYSAQRATKYISALIEKVELAQDNHEHYPPCQNRKLKKIGARKFTYKKQYKVIYVLRKGNIVVLSVSGARRNPKYLDDLI